MSATIELLMSSYIIVFNANWVNDTFDLHVGVSRSHARGSPDRASTDQRGDLPPLRFDFVVSQNCFMLAAIELFFTSCRVLL